MKRFIIIMYCAVVSACMLLSCTTVNIAGGNSSGTGNGAIAFAASDRIDGVTRPKAKVLLFSQDWMPLMNTGTYSDSSAAGDSGAFTFANIPHGYYNLIIFTAGEKSSGIFKNIPCQPGVTWTDTIDTLKEPGFLRGLAIVQKDTLALSYVYVRGTPFHAMTDTHGEFLMGALPPSQYTLQMYGLFTTSPNGPVKAFTIASVTGSLDAGAITDSLSVTIYPDSIVQFGR